MPRTSAQHGEQARPTTAKDEVDMADLEKHLSRKSTRKNKMEPEIYPLMDTEKGLVGWDSQDDPTNPRSVVSTVQTIEPFTDFDTQEFY
jgi:hypothetical protein